MMIFLSFNQQVLAQSYDQKYLEWKLKQETHDRTFKGKESTVNDTLGTSGQYATTNKIKLNSATVNELQQLTGIGLKKAEAIIEYRNKNGKFKSIEDIQQVKGIGLSLFEKNKLKLVL